MLTTAPIVATIPVVDLERAKRFYTDLLGLKLDAEYGGMLKVDAGRGTSICLYQRGPSKADHTLASFIVDDIVATVKDLAAKGVVFEDYDFPGLKTDEHHVATQGKDRAAWFRDSEGNIIGLNQLG